MVAFSSLARISGECSTIHSPRTHFFVLFCFEVEISGVKHQVSVELNTKYLSLPAPAVQHERGPRKPKLKMGEGSEGNGLGVTTERDTPMDLTVGGASSRGVLPYKFPAPDGPAPPDNAFMLMGYAPSWGDIVRVQVNTSDLLLFRFCAQSSCSSVRGLPIVGLGCVAFLACLGSVSYTHLTLPTRRTV